MPFIYPRFLTEPNSEVSAEKYKNYPETIVIVAVEELREYAERLDRLEETEVNVSESLEEIFVHISDQGMLGCAMDILKDSVVHLYSRVGYNDDGKIISDAMVKFAGSMAKELSTINAYDDKGALPYRFKAIDDYENIVLVKCLDYV